MPVVPDLPEELGLGSADLATARNIIGSAPLARLDYLEIVNAETLETVTETGPDSLMAVAAFFGQTRLIDNLRFS